VFYYYCFFVQSNFDEMMNRYKQLLTYIKTAVTRNHSEKSINSILDYISTSKNVSFCNTTNYVYYNSSLAPKRFFEIFFCKICVFVYIM